MRTDNPVRDEEMRQAELESSFHVCCCECGTPIYEGEEAWLVCDEWWCDECARDEFMREVRNED